MFSFDDVIMQLTTQLSRLCDKYHFIQMIDHFFQKCIACLIPKAFSQLTLTLTVIAVYCPKNISLWFAEAYSRSRSLDQNIPSLPEYSVVITGIYASLPECLVIMHHGILSVGIENEGH